MQYGVIDIILELVHHLCMRTTLSIDDDAFRLVQEHAARRSLPLGKAVSELVRRAVATPLPTRMVNGILVFDPPADSPRVSMEKVRELRDELE